MSFAKYDAVQNISVSIASMEEFLDKFFQKKEDKEFAISVLLTAPRSETIKNVIKIKIKDEPRIKELFATYDLTGKKEYLNLPDEISVNIEALSMMVIKSVTSANDELMELLNQKIDALHYALQHLYFNDRWVDFCFAELNMVYRRCLAQDRQKYDKEITEALHETIKYVSTVSNAVGLMERKSEKFKQIKKAMDYGGEEEF